jgi:hypothetical protein
MLVILTFFPFFERNPLDKNQPSVYPKPCGPAGSHTAPFWACIRTKSSHTHCFCELKVRIYLAFGRVCEQKVRIHAVYANFGSHTERYANFLFAYTSKTGTIRELLKKNKKFAYIPENGIIYEPVFYQSMSGLWYYWQYDYSFNVLGIRCFASPDKGLRSKTRAGKMWV